MTEQIGRVEYLNGVNHIEAEETSAGEKMLVKAMVKFKDNSVRYPFDVMDGYNHLGVVWSNRTQHAAAHAYLQQAQQAFLRFKKLRQAALDQLTDEERQYVAAEDKKQQEEVVVVEEETTTAATVTDVSVEKKDDAETKSADDDKESASAAAAAAASSTAFAVAPRTLSLSPSAPGFRFLDSVFWHRLEVTHTLTLFFLAQVFGHMKKRDLAAIYCHLCLNRQLKQRQDFQRTEWVTNAIGLSFYYSGRKLFQQAHHCLLAAQSFIDEKDMPKKMNTPTASVEHQGGGGGLVCGTLPQSSVTCDIHTTLTISTPLAVLCVCTVTPVTRVATSSWRRICVVPGVPSTSSGCSVRATSSLSTSSRPRLPTRTRARAAVRQSHRPRMIWARSTRRPRSHRCRRTSWPS